MVLTFADQMPPKNLTAGQHVDKLGKIADKLASVQRRTPSEIAAIELRDRAIQTAYGYARDINSHRLKLPDGVALTPEELKLAKWIFGYADEQKIPVKEAMAHVLEYLRRNPTEMAYFTKGDVSFGELLSGATGLTGAAAQDEFQATESAFGHLRRLHFYQAVTGCSFCEAVGDVL